MAASSPVVGRWKWRWRGSRRPAWRAAPAFLWQSWGIVAGSGRQCSGQWRWRTGTWWMLCNTEHPPPPRCRRKSGQTPSNPKPARRDLGFREKRWKRRCVLTAKLIYSMQVEPVWRNISNSVGFVSDLLLTLDPEVGFPFKDPWYFRERRTCTSHTSTFISIVLFILLLVLLQYIVGCVYMMFHTV